MFDGALAASALLVGVLNMLEINKLKKTLEADREKDASGGSGSDS